MPPALSDSPGVTLANAAAGPSASQEPPRPPRPTLADLMDQPPDAAARWIPGLARMAIDDARATAAGIRRLTSERLTLYTDLPASEGVDGLPTVFDQAFPQWCEYFHADRAKHADWKLTGFLMKDKERFRQAGLLPEELPPFQHGFAWNFDFWWHEQPSDYYRRHLMLHEGTHAWMNTILGACGPPWYMEGMAEMLATHRWQDGRLTLGCFPASRDGVPEWGRIRLIQDAVAQRRAQRLPAVIDYSAGAYLQTEAYAWSWAAAALMDGHPRYRERFRKLHENVLRPGFNQQFLQAMGADWDLLCEEWQVFVTGMEYGYDVGAMAIDFTPGKPLPTGGAEVTVAAQGGWQNSGLRLEGGASHRLRASGRYQVADRPQVWWCEPGGVSIRYYHGQPLGILLAAVRSDQGGASRTSALVQPTAIGLEATLTPPESGTLYLRVNDSAAELGDNAGELKVRIDRQ